MTIMTDDAVQATPTIHPFVFSGTTREYFPIWIVNLLLTVCTLGIYSAWAKVRTLRWFYGHTQLNGHSFDYHATGWRILKGRLLALLLIGFMAILFVVHPLMQLVNVLLLALLIPWAINASLRFQLRMSSWRNVRFDFSGSYGRALWLYVGLPLVMILGVWLLVFAIGMGLMTNPRVREIDLTFNILVALGVAAAALIVLVTLLIIPIVVRLRALYLVGNTQLGAAPFAVTLTLKRLYRLIGRSALVGLAVFVVAKLLTFGIFWLWSVFSDTGISLGDDRWFFYALMFAAYVGFYAAIGAFAVYFTIHVRNETLNQLTIAGTHRMCSTLSPWKVLWIVCSNAVVVLVTLGLMLPWARVRYYRYVCGQIALVAADDLDQFVSANAHAPSSFGGEFGAMEGIDVGLGI